MEETKVVKPADDEKTAADIPADDNLAEEENKEQKTFEKIESHLLGKIEEGDEASKFLLAQFYYEEGKLEEAVQKFEEIQLRDFQAMYQLATMYYDGIGCEKDEEKGFELMMKVATSTDEYAAHLKYSAQYNIGKAYFEGFGVKQSDAEALKWWLLAAGDGDPRACVEAQTMLGLFYARPEFIDLKKSFFWHSEACGNGSLESQGIMGVMYMMGQGVKKNMESAFECLKEASDRGNVYAQGRLIQLYYEQKLYTKACDLARKVITYKDIDKIAERTGCLPEYINKGIALACFYISRSLHFGKGLKKDLVKSKKYSDRLCELDPEMAHDGKMDSAYGYV